MAWFDSSWPYRKAITITNSGSSLSDYPVKITLDTASLVSAGKLRSDGGDIRFTDSDGTTLLNYWIESGINTSTTVIWVKVPSILAGSKTIYFYYGNPQATSQSNGVNVFSFFDDFEQYADGSNINNQGGWITKRVGGTGEAKVRLYNGGNHLHLSSTDYTTAVVNPFNSSNSGYAIRVREVADDWNEAFLFGVTDGSTSANGGVLNAYVVTWNGWSGTLSKIRKFVTGNENVLNSISDSDSNNVYHILEFTWVGSSLKAYRDDQLKLSGSDSYYSSRSHIHLDVYNGTSRYIDWVLIRKAASTEPSSSTGNEETLVNKSTDYLLDIYNLATKENIYLFDLRNIISIDREYLFSLGYIKLKTFYKFDIKNLAQIESFYLNDIRNLLSISSEYRNDIFPGLERDFSVKGLAPFDRDVIIKGIDYRSLYRSFILRGTDRRQNDRDYILAGKGGVERDYIIKPRDLIEASFILEAYEILPPQKTRRLTLFDPIRLRTTAVYRKPRSIETLKIVYGDLSNSRIPCIPLDADGYMYHISDRPMQLISKIYVNGEPKTFGFRTFSSYQDETGNRIACVIFDNPQYEKKVSVSGKGAIKLDTGELIENPADIVRDILINIQGYDISSIDIIELSRFYADCLEEEVRIAFILKEGTLKTILDEIARNIHAHWMISDGKAVMRLRWR